MNETSSVASWLVRHAARGTPNPLAERLEEEWLADLAARQSPLSRMCFAFGCYWATQVICFEKRPALVLASPQALFQLTRRSSPFLLVASLHALLFYAVLHAVTLAHHRDTPPPLQNQVLDIPRSVVLPRIDDPVWHRPPLYVPPREFPLQTDAEDVRQVISTNVDPAVPPQAVDLATTQVMPPPHSPALLQGGPGTGFPNSDDFYPSIARRMEEQGSVTLRVCVDVKGRLTADPSTTQSSGNDRLDQGAIRLAKTASGHYRPSTEDGRPVSACYPLRVRFQIKH